MSSSLLVADSIEVVDLAAEHFLMCLVSKHKAPDQRTLLFHFYMDPCMLRREPLPEPFDFDKRDKQDTSKRTNYIRIPICTYVVLCSRFGPGKDLANVRHTRTKKIAILFGARLRQCSQKAALPFDATERRQMYDNEDTLSLMLGRRPNCSLHCFHEL